MANLDLSKATADFFMNSETLVQFDTVDIALPTLWSFRNPSADMIRLLGEGLTYDGQGHALSGNVTTIAFDLGDNNPASPDVLITGVNLAAPPLDDGSGSFWRFLEGNDVFTLSAGPYNLAGPAFDIFGDASTARAGYAVGGNDTIHANRMQASVTGDVDRASTQFQGGNDTIDGLVTSALQSMVGDANQVDARGKVTGGNDTIVIRSTNGFSRAIGDVGTVDSTGPRADVIGGNDVIAAGMGSPATLIGDVDRQLGNSFVRGGNDELYGADLSDLIVGDVNIVGSRNVTGGDDMIWGYGGGDRISGDVGTLTTGSKLVGGNDVIYGGEGNDVLYGDIASGNLADVTGGNDELFGEDGDDILIGAAGNDVLVGGTGKDAMFGGAGNDDYVIDSALDTVNETAGQGIDLVKTLINDVVLADNVENLSSLWIGDFTASGNDLNNTMSAGGGSDLLRGKGGNDTLIGLGGPDTLSGDDGNDTLLGGAGGDLLAGGDGIDTASYAGATAGVKVALDGSFVGEGDAFGDTFISVERLVGSDYRDVMRGDANANMLTGGGGNDSLQGGNGNDVLIGGAGRDSLNGGAGNDRFDFLALGDGNDTIADFGTVAGNDDTLRFDGDAFGGLPAGALAAVRFVANAAGVATTLDQRFVYETDTGILRYDANGSAAGGVAVIATLTGTPTLSAGDITIA